MGYSLRIGLLALGLVGAACGDSAEAPDCSSASLSYEATAGALGEKYCTSCHDSSLPEGLARSNAPADVNFDTEEGWLEHGTHALEEIEAGRMPAIGPKPSAGEVDGLEQWLACEGATDHDEPHEH